MDGIKQQRWTKLRPELRIPPVPFLEKWAPVLEQLTTTPGGILIRFPDRNREGSPRFRGAPPVSISTGDLSCPQGLPLSPSCPIGAG